MKLRKASALFMAAAMSASMFVVPAAADETEDPAKAIPEDVIPDETVTLNVLTVMELMRHVWSQVISAIL